MRIKYGLVSPVWVTLPAEEVTDMVQEKADTASDRETAPGSADKPSPSGDNCVACGFKCIQGCV